jgi:predicted RNA-binding protein
MTKFGTEAEAVVRQLKADDACCADDIMLQRLQAQGTERRIDLRSHQ